MDRARMKQHYNCWWLRAFDPFGGGIGLTIGSHIFWRGRRETVTPALLAHEMVHIKQYEEMGIIRFLWVYLIGLIKLGNKPISEHPLEKPAYVAQNAVV